MKSQMKYGLIGLFIGGVAVWLYMSANLNSNTQNAARNSDRIDAHFIEQMIPHHEDAITMAKVAQTKAQRPEVKQLAQNIIDSQGKEINQMNSWYKNWFGRVLPTGSEVMNQHGMMGNSSGLHMGVSGDASDMTKLEQAADFDTAFVEHMISHHQMAVMMASMLKDGTERSEMKQLADEIVSAQTNEIDQMRSWLKEWGEQK